MLHIDDELELEGVLTKEDIASVHKVMASHEAAIVSLDEEIAELTRKLNTLRFKKSQHQDCIVHCKGIITLARRIPDELLASIFTHAAREWSRAPLVVSQVCSSWRRAANTPSVWSHLRVDCGSQNPIARTQFWLSKARQAPLHITLEAESDWYLWETMDILLDHISHWRSFALLCGSGSLTAVLARCTRPAPELRDLSVVIQNESDRHDMVGFADAFKLAPNLSSMTLVHNAIPAPGIIPPTITDLSLTLVSPTFQIQHTIRFLEGLPELRKLALRTSMSDELLGVDLDFDSSAPVSLLSLHTLTLCVSPNANVILPYIDAPSLRRLHLQSSTPSLGQPHEPTGQSLRLFFQRSRPPLELLELRDVDITPDDFSACFAVLPMLTELRLHETDIPDGVLQLVDGSEGLCPLLKRLDLRWCGQLTGQALARLVRSRAGVTQPIEEVAIMHCSFVNERDIFDIAERTTCRVVMRETDDMCRG
jgi:hypothetical protein